MIVLNISFHGHPRYTFTGGVVEMSSSSAEMLLFWRTNPPGLGKSNESLGSYHASLVLPWLSHYEGAFLEDGEGITEDEVDGARDGAPAVELTVFVGVEAVLVPEYIDVEEHCLVP